MRRWLWVTLPDVYLTQPLPVGETGTWTCDADSAPGDIALLYRADLFQDFSHVFRVDRGPFYDDQLSQEFGSEDACECTVVAALQTPVTLARLRADRVLSQLPAAQVGFHGTAFPLDAPYWKAFLNLASPLDPSASAQRWRAALRPTLRRTNGADRLGRDPGVV